MTRALIVCLIAAGLLGAVAPAGAVSYLDRVYGTPETGLSPRSRALGGAGAALGNGAYSLVDNPANLILLRGSRVSGVASAARVSENRFVPLFDTFDSFVDESAIAVNDHGYASIQGGAVLDEWGDRGPVISAGIFNRYDARYDYEDELRSTDTFVPPNERDKIVNNRYIDTEGILRSASLGVAYPVTPEIGVGVAVNYYYGTIEERNGLVVTAEGASLTTDTTFVTRTERKLDGVSFTFGGNARITDRIGVGASIETAPQIGYDLQVDQTGTLGAVVDTTGDLSLPLRVQAGLVYHPRNALRTTFAADIVYMPWTDGADDNFLAGSFPANDTWEVRFGLEHVFYNDLPARIGFRYGESYAVKEADRATFTFGFGYVLERLQIDIGGEVGKWITRQDPIRSRADQGPRVGLGRDRVEDTAVRIYLGADYAF